MNLILILLMSTSVAEQQDEISQLRSFALQGNHHMTSCSMGLGYFNAREARTFMRIDSVEDGQLSGVITTFGLSWSGEPKDLNEKLRHVSRFEGQYRGNKLTLTFRRTGKSRNGGDYEATTTLHGLYENGKIIGYFTDEWKYSDRTPVINGGIYEFNAKQTDTD